MLWPSNEGLDFSIFKDNPKPDEKVEQAFLIDDVFNSSMYGGSYHIEINQWTGLCIMGTSVMKDLDPVKHLWRILLAKIAIG